jgi:lysophospholipid hydrolase
MNLELAACFHDAKIEDLFLNSFCVTTDLSDSCSRTHHCGTVWRYVRASMSLAGFVPPICDVDVHTKKVHYLLDGGYTNLLPADVMRAELGANTVIASDVSTDWSFAGSAAYGDSLSGSWSFLSNLNPFGTTRVPKMGDIMGQLAFLSCQVRLQKTLAEDVCLYLTPPVAEYGTLAFQEYHAIEEKGYNYHLAKLSQWKKGVLSTGGERAASIFGSSHKKSGARRSLEAPV